MCDDVSCSLQPQVTIANGSSTSGGGVASHRPGRTLIQFGSDSDDDDTNEQGHPPGMKISPPQGTTTAATHHHRHHHQHKSPFGDFDPWGPTATARSMDLLDLEENLSPPSDSEQSEVRTVGTEAFKKKSTSLRSSPVPAANFGNLDPFSGKPGGGGGGDVFGNPAVFGHSGSSESLLKPIPPSQNPVGSGSSLLSPSVTSNSSSAPNVSALGSGTAPSFAPTLSDIPQSPGSRSMSKQQGNSGANHGFAAGRTSPFGAQNFASGGNSTLRYHSQSTGHLQPQMSRGGRGGGMRGSNRADPFSDLGNVKVGASGGNGGQSAAKPSRVQSSSQGVPAMTSRPGYQYYPQKAPQGQQGQGGHKQGSGQAGKASYQTNYSSSVLGDRSERAPRTKTGQIHTCSLVLVHILDDRVSKYCAHTHCTYTQLLIWYTMTDFLSFLLCVHTHIYTHSRTTHTCTQYRFESASKPE